MFLPVPRMRLIAASLAALVAAIAAQDPAPRAPAPLTIVTRDGRRPLPTVAAGGQEMVALSDLAAQFQLTVYEDAAAGGLTVTYKGRSIVLTPGQALASVGGRLVSLPAPALKDARGWLVPVEFINRALAPIYDSRLEVRRPARLVIVGDVRVPRVAIRYESVGAQARVTLEVRPRTPHTVMQEGNRLLVRLEADALDASMPALEPGPLVQGIAIAGPGTIAVLEGPRFGSFRSSDAPADPDGIRIVLDISPAASETAGPAAPAPGPAPAPAPEALPFFEGPPPVLRTVVIDPGHGGDEPGATGAGGTLEKHVTLGVARRLKAAIEGRLGLRVILTRDGDHTVRLDERAAVANNNKADLFISLHANASPQSAVAGAEVFFLSLDEYGEEAQRLTATAAPVLPVFGGGTRTIDVIRWDMAQAQHVDRSEVLARTVEQQLRSRVPMSSRALQQAPFRVLVGANMPAVLIEMGFLTNPVQERQLASDTFQNGVAQALLESIVRFRDHLEGERARGAPVGGP